MSQRTCTVNDCDRRHYGRGLCRLHWDRQYRARLPRKFIKGDDAARFRSYVQVDQETGCWEWTSYKKKGYGLFYSQWRQWRAHIWAWVQVNGPVPDGLQLDHFACDNPGCVNPDHVRPVSSWENTLRSTSPAAQNKAKEFCKRGHEFTAENTRTVANGSGRACILCQQAYGKDYYQQNREHLNRKRAARRAAAREARR